MIQFCNRHNIYHDVLDRGRAHSLVLKYKTQKACVLVTEIDCQSKVMKAYEDLMGSSLNLLAQAWLFTEGSSVPGLGTISACHKAFEHLSTFALTIEDSQPWWAHVEFLPESATCNPTWKELTRR